MKSTDVFAEGPDRVRLLLWSPKGAGEHYHGPGTATYRLYASQPAGPFELTLGHGFSEQEKLALFARQCFVSDYSGRVLSQGKFLAAAFRWLQLNGHQFDVFHGVSSFHACALPAAWAEQRGLRSVLRVAGYRSDLADKGGWRKLFGLPRRRRTLVRNLSGMVAISSAIAEELLSYGVPERKIALIPNGVDTSRFQPLSSADEKSALRARLGWRNATTIAFVGGINRRKQPHLLLEAVERLKSQGYDFHVVYAGPIDDVPYFEAMRHQIEQAGLTSHVTWLGFTRDIARVYRAADVFVLPSSSEGMPNALLEAMATGLAVVSTRVSGATDAITHGENGTLVSRCKDAVAEALVRYVRDDDVRNAHGDAARARILDQFSASSVYQAHIKLFESLVAGTGAPRDASLLAIGR